MILLETGNKLLFLITAAMLLVIFFFTACLFFFFQKRKIRFLQQQLSKENYEQEILKTQIGIRDRAMNDVARELLDHIVPVMILMKINMNLLAGKGLEVVSEQRLDDTKNRLKKTISDIRMLGKTLHADLIPQPGLVDSIKHEPES